ETIIEELFEGTDLARHKESTVLTRENEKDRAVRRKSRQDAKDDRNEASLRHPTALNQQSIDAPAQPSLLNVAKPSVKRAEIKSTQPVTPHQSVHTEPLVH
ncbi:coagulase, partial [Staphylococcus pseudintermedius]